MNFQVQILIKTVFLYSKDSARVRGEAVSRIQERKIRVETNVRNVQELLLLQCIYNNNILFHLFIYIFLLTLF